MYILYIYTIIHYSYTLFRDDECEVGETGGLLRVVYTASRVVRVGGTEKIIFK